RDTFTIFAEMGVPVESIRLGGGGARSRVWRQIQADVYGREVELVEADEGAAYCAALLAGVGGGAWGSVEEACAASVRVRERVAPEPETARHMDERYKAFQKLYPALRGIFERD
ncbi:MAG TPA: FGGY-family carbohydrate kinase, partial [Pyrinomonadaceae bacterium]